MDDCEQNELINKYIQLVESQHFEGLKTLLSSIGEIELSRLMYFTIRACPNKYFDILVGYTHEKYAVPFLKAAVNVNNRYVVDYYSKIVKVIHTDYLKFSCIDGSLNFVKFLVDEYKIDPSFENNICIQCAGTSGHIDIVEFLLKDNRVNPLDNNMLPIILIDHQEVLELYIKNGIVSKESKTIRGNNLFESMLSRAIMDTGNRELAKYLISIGVKVHHEITESTRYKILGLTVPT